MNLSVIKSYAPVSSGSSTETFTQSMLQTLLRKGITKSTAAARLGISISTLNRLLRGTYLDSSPKTFASLLGLYCAVTYSDQYSSEIH